MAADYFSRDKLPVLDHFRFQNRQFISTYFTNIQNAYSKGSFTPDPARLGTCTALARFRVKAATRGAVPYRAVPCRTCRIRRERSSDVTSSNSEL